MHEPLISFYSRPLQHDIDKGEHEQLVIFVGGEKKNEQGDEGCVTVEVKPLEIEKAEYAVRPLFLRRRGLWSLSASALSRTGDGPPLLPKIGVTVLPAVRRITAVLLPRTILLLGGVLLMALLMPAAILSSLGAVLRGIGTVVLLR